MYKLIFFYSVNWKIEWIYIQPADAIVVYHVHFVSIFYILYDTNATGKIHRIFK